MKRAAILISLMFILLSGIPANGMADAFLVHQDFAWDVGSGYFITTNIYTQGKIDNYAAERCEVLHGGASGATLPVGASADYLAYSATGGGWIKSSYCGAYSAETINRWAGKDITDEATVTRFDQVAYDSILSNTYNAATAYVPMCDISLANGWFIALGGSYTQWGWEATMFNPAGGSATVYGDPHLSQSNSAVITELAAVGDYAFDLGNGYTATFLCRKAKDGYSVVTEFILTGPNGYTLSIGRNGEFRRTGGTNPQAATPEMAYYLLAPADAATLATSTVRVWMEATGNLDSATLTFGGANYPMTGAGRLWQIELNNVPNGVYEYIATGNAGAVTLTTAKQTVTVNVAAAANAEADAATKTTITASSGSNCFLETIGAKTPFEIPALWILVMIGLMAFFGRTSRR